MLASGPPEARERCAPVFDAVGARTVALGDEPGAATRMKLVLNTWLLALSRASPSRSRWPRASGSTRGAFLEIIDGGPLGPPYAKMKGTMMIERVLRAELPARARRQGRPPRARRGRRGRARAAALRAIRGQLEKAVEAGPRRRGHGGGVEASRPGD